MKSTYRHAVDVSNAHPGGGSIGGNAILGVILIKGKYGRMYLGMRVISTPGRGKLGSVATPPLPTATATQQYLGVVPSVFSVEANVLHVQRLILERQEGTDEG